mgnify:CR=1 FL=1
MTTFADHDLMFPGGAIPNRGSSQFFGDACDLRKAGRPPATEFLQSASSPQSVRPTLAGLPFDTRLRQDYKIPDLRIPVHQGFGACCESLGED